MTILVNENIPPVIKKLRRIRLALKKQVEEKLNNLLSRGIIERVEGPVRWISPIVVVMKDSGDIRLCLDMRMVNKAGL